MKKYEHKLSLREYFNWCAIIWKGKPRAKYTLRDDYIMGMGLSGEVGEVQELLKKSVRGRRKVDLKNLEKELGDVLYYWMIICHRHGIDPQDVIQTNVKKLEARYRKKRKTK